MNILTLSNCLALEFCFFHVSLCCGFVLPLCLVTLVSHIIITFEPYRSSLFLQISLIDAPGYRRRKAMALSPNIMRDSTDKVSCQNGLSKGFDVA